MSVQEPDVESPLNGQGVGHSKLFRSFVIMSLCFSLNHGTVTAVLGLSGAILSDDKLAGASSGTLYICYTLSALFAAPGLVSRLGAKRSLDIGLSMYCFYVASFLVAILIPAIKWPACIIGSFIGGLAAGWIWTAQGSYFSRSSALVAEQLGEPIEVVNSRYAAIFAALYVGMEVAMKLIGPLVLHFMEKKSGQVFLYILWTSIAVVSAFATISMVRKLPKDPNEKKLDAIERLKGAVSLLTKNKKIVLLGFFNVAFGLVSALVISYINGTVTKAALKDEGVALLSSGIAVVATAMSFPMSWVANRFSKLPLMVFGAVCWCLVACIVAFQSEASLIGWGWNLTIIYILVGTGRAVFESTNKATFADMFPNDRTNAFAIIIVQSGGSASAAFFIFPLLSPHLKAWIALVSSGMAVIALFYVFAAYWKEQKESKLLSTGIASDE